MNILHLFFLIFQISARDDIYDFHEFNFIIHHEFQSGELSMFKKHIRGIWAASEYETFKKLYYNFELIECDGSIYNRSVFYERYIKNKNRPKIMNGGSFKDIREYIDVERNYYQRTSELYYDYHLDVEGNGVRMALEIEEIRLRRAIVYNCEGYELMTYRDYGPFFKAQKMLNEMWKFFKTGKSDLVEKDYFLEDFTYLTCPDDFNSTKKLYSLGDFIKEFSTASSYTDQAYVMDAIVADKSFHFDADKWQAHVEWGYKQMLIHLEDIEDVLKITMGREYPCKSW